MPGSRWYKYSARVLLSSTNKTVTLFRWLRFGQESMHKPPTFNLDYNGGLYINKDKGFQDEVNILPFPPDHEMFAQVATNEFTKCKILSIQKIWWYLYTVPSYDNGEIHQHGHWDLFDYDPSSSSTFTNNQWYKTLPLWISHECKTILFLPTMDKPKNAYLISTQDKWLFKSRRGYENHYIELLNFHTVARDMIKQFVIFEGHKRFQDILHVRTTITSLKQLLQNMFLPVASHA